MFKDLYNKFSGLQRLQIDYEGSSQDFSVDDSLVKDTYPHLFEHEGQNEDCTFSLGFEFQG